MPMPLSPSGIAKPLVWFLWFIASVILIIHVFKGQISVEGALLKGGAYLALILAWTIGLHQYLFSFFSPSSSIFTHSKGFLVRSISSLFYFILFFGIFFFNDASIINKATYMTALSLMSLLWAFVLYSRIRLIEGTPHTRLNSAAQGYAVLEGKVSLYDGEVVRGPHKELPPMVWYSKYLYTSSAGFLLDDGNGICTIDPRDAEVITPLKHYAPYTYHAIYPAETVYVIGQFETLSKQRNEHERKALVSSKIVEWKRDSIKFLDYFDKNKDGTIDDVEMAVVRNAADRVVDNSLEEVYQQPASHVVSSPTDGRPFILSSIHPEELIKHYKLALILHLSAWLTLTAFLFAMRAL
jgi:hypothetical protein